VLILAAAVAVVLGAFGGIALARAVGSQA
jgi:hypothetical protein